MVKGYRTLGITTLSEATLVGIVDSDYPNMKIIKHDQKYEIQNPPFGPPYIIEMLKERAAFEYDDEFQPLIRVHNQRVMVMSVNCCKFEMAF